MIFLNYEIKSTRDIMNVIPSQGTPPLTYELMSKGIMIKMSLSHTSRNAQMPKAFYPISLPNAPQWHGSNGRHLSSEIP